MSRRFLPVLALPVVLAACAHGHGSHTADARRPPAASSWPSPPRFSKHSCWARPLLSGTGPEPAAAAQILDQRDRGRSPSAIVRSTLSRLGDRTFVRGVELGPPPPATHQHPYTYFGHGRPPRDALWAYISAPASIEPVAKKRIGGHMVASWEAALVAGALRDRFCAAGGRPLVGWSVNSPSLVVSDSVFPFGQRFPNPSPRAFKGRLARVASTYGFDVVALRLLHPLGLAPLVVVQTHEKPGVFAERVPKIIDLLNPRNGQAATFEGFFFEARDAHGVPFVRTENVLRGEVEGGQWASRESYYPFPHL